MDEANQLECTIKIGSVPKKPTDYLSGMIVQENKRIVSKVYGTYLGYIDFDGIRYWDRRHSDLFEFFMTANLPSDSEFREDLVALRDGNMELAQSNKEMMENSQRNDRELREKFLNH